MTDNEFEKQFAKLPPYVLKFRSNLREDIKQYLGADAFVGMMNIGFDYFNGSGWFMQGWIATKILGIGLRLGPFLKKLPFEDHKFMEELLRILLKVKDGTKTIEIINFFSGIQVGPIINICNYYLEPKNIDLLNSIGLLNEHLTKLNEYAVKKNNKELLAKIEAARFKEGEIISMDEKIKKSYSLGWIVLFILAMLFIAIILFFLTINVILYIIIWRELHHAPPWFVAVAALLGNFIGTIYLLTLLM